MADYLRRVGPARTFRTIAKPEDVLWHIDNFLMTHHPGPTPLGDGWACTFGALLPAGREGRLPVPVPPDRPAWVIGGPAHAPGTWTEAEPGPRTWDGWEESYIRGRPEHHGGLVIYRRSEGIESLVELRALGTSGVGDDIMAGLSAHLERELGLPAEAEPPKDIFSDGAATLSRFKAAVAQMRADKDADAATYSYDDIATYMVLDRRQVLRLRMTLPPPLNGRRLRATAFVQMVSRA